MRTEAWFTAIGPGRPLPFVSGRLARPRTTHLALLSVAGATLAGGLLRLLMMRGDLWLDETWSLKLVAGLRSPWAVFWEVSHDNNHFLNSLWMYGLGQDRPAWAYRVPAVLFGTASIPLAALVGWRRSRAAGVAAAWLAAFATPLVVYGSEARGYAGLVAAILLAFAAFEPALRHAVSGHEDQGPAGRSPATWWLGFAIGFGLLCHLTMLATLGVLSLAAVLRFKATDRSLRRSLDQTIHLFGPSLLALLPAAAAVTAGIAHRGGFEYGDVVPFTGADFLTGFGGMLRAMLGLAESLPTALVVLAGGLLVLADLRLGRGDPLWRCVVVSALVALPASMAAAHLPNLEMPRYFLVCGVALLLVLADVVGRSWIDGSPTARLLGATLLGAVLVGEAAADADALTAGRGHYSEMLSSMARDGRVSFSSDSRFKTETVAEVATRRLDLALSYVPADRFCTEMPEWYIVTDPASASRAMLTIGPETCRRRYDVRATFPAPLLSGMRWTLYRRDT